MTRNKTFKYLHVTPTTVTSGTHKANKDITQLTAAALKPVYMWQFEALGKIISLLLSVRRVWFCCLLPVSFLWMVNKQIWITEILLNYVILCCAALRHKRIHKYLEGLNISPPHCALVSLSSSTLVSALLCFSKLESERSQNQQGGWRIKREGRGEERR